MSLMIEVKFTLLSGLNLFNSCFLFQVDGLQDEAKMEAQRDISQHWIDDCNDMGLEDKVEVSFYLTSIYDHSIFEAFSKVVQKLIPELPTLEGLLNLFTSVKL